MTLRLPWKLYLSSGIPLISFLTELYYKSLQFDEGLLYICTKKVRMIGLRECAERKSHSDTTLNSFVIYN